MKNSVQLIEPECPSCGGATFTSSDMHYLARATLERMHTGQQAQVIDGSTIKMSCVACGHEASRNEVYSKQECGMTNSDELIESLRANGGDGMWVEQAVILVDVLRGSRVDPQSPTLLDDMSAERFDDPKISDWLYKLPGHRVGDMTTAERHLSYLTGQIKSASKKGTDT